jgi:hypothetical protein
MLGRVVARSSWDRIPWWPPDVFACTAVLLHVTGAFRFVVSPPPGRVWPPHPDWRERVEAAAREWASVGVGGEQHLPPVVVENWNLLTAARDLPLEEIASGERWEACVAILTLHALADEACSGLADHHGDEVDSLEGRAWRMVSESGSLSRLPSSGIRVLPKTHLAQGGINLRSLSRHLSSHVSPVEVSWTRVLLGDVRQRSEQDTAWHVLLIPWPLEVKDSDFRPSPGPLPAMDPEAFGFFQFDPSERLDLSFIRAVLESARDRGRSVDAVVLPEAAILPDEIEPLEDAVLEHGAAFLAAGVRQPSDPVTHLGRNYAHIGLWDGESWTRLQAEKHHRWNIDTSQIDQYCLAGVLSTDKQWWEGISIPRRGLPILDVGGGATTSVLICEDLARLDEVAEVLRYVGPTFVIALLLDGPQLATRWSSRYASVLADDPGSAVLTLTSLGMAARCRYDGQSGSRVIALWKDADRGFREIDLEEGASAVLLRVGERRKTVWTADGRRHAERTPRLILEDVHQIGPLRGALQEAI